VFFGNRVVAPFLYHAPPRFAEDSEPRLANPLILRFYLFSTVAGRETGRIPLCCAWSPREALCVFIRNNRVPPGMLSNQRLRSLSDIQGAGYSAGTSLQPDLPHLPQSRLAGFMIVRGHLMCNGQLQFGGRNRAGIPFPVTARFQDCGKTMISAFRSTATPGIDLGAGGLKKPADPATDCVCHQA